jgi:hypothetical protein
MVDDAIDRLLTALARAGVPLPTEPITDAALATVTEALRPFRIPPDLVAVWHRFQAGPGTTIEWTSCQPAVDALRAREMDREIEADWPPCLFALGTEGMTKTFVELDLPDGPAGRGAVWVGSYDDDQIAPIAPTLAEALVASAIAWERRILRWEAPFATLGGRLEAWRSLLGELFPELSWPVSRWRPLTWPSHWQAAAGINPAAAIPRGPTTTLLALRERMANAGPESATVHGRIVRLGGTNEASLITLDDGTARLEVWVPREADRFGAVAMGNRVELDVETTAGRSRRREIEAEHAGVSAAAMSGDMPTAQAGGLRLAAMLVPESAEAVAMAARPLPDELPGPPAADYRAR